jgi:hypothetical protein
MKTLSLLALGLFTYEETKTVMSDQPEFNQIHVLKAKVPDTCKLFCRK